MSSRTFLRGLTGLVAAAALMICLSGSEVASAHGVTVVSSNPSAGSSVESSPAEVGVQFNEELVSRESTLFVLDAMGVRVDRGDGRVDLDDVDHASMRVSLMESLPDGSYTVAWHAVLTDGDASDGQFAFSVAGPSVEPAIDVSGSDSAMPDITDY